MLTPSHPPAEALPVTAGQSLLGCSTPPDQLDRLQEASRKYRAYQHWSRIRLGSSEKPITGQGFNAVKFDPRKPARTIRRNDGNLGMHGAMHWSECRRFSLPEFKRFGSFPDAFCFAGGFEEGIRQIGNSVPPLFMRAIAKHICCCMFTMIVNKSPNSVENCLIPSKGTFEGRDLTSILR